jgi:hypothetical protein
VDLICVAIEAIRHRRVYGIGAWKESKGQGSKQY